MLPMRSYLLGVLRPQRLVVPNVEQSLYTSKAIIAGSCMTFLPVVVNLGVKLLVFWELSY